MPIARAAMAEPSHTPPEQDSAEVQRTCAVCCRPINRFPDASHASRKCKELLESPLALVTSTVVLRTFHSQPAVQLCPDHVHRRMMLLRQASRVPWNDPATPGEGPSSMKVYLERLERDRPQDFAQCLRDFCIMADVLQSS